jgi:murein DD-endopeptidase MepM/ murein hydrolase activator NlpD
MGREVAQFKAAVLIVVAVVGVSVTWSATEARLGNTIPVAQPIVVTTAHVTRSDRLRRDETLTHLLARHEVEGPELQQLLAAARAEGLDPRRLRPDMVFEFRYSLPEKSPDRLTVRLDRERYLKLGRGTAGEWWGKLEEITWTVFTERVEGTIPVRGSLDGALHATIPDSVLPFAERQQLIWNVAEGVYAWIIDFYRDLRPDDRFQILYERLVSDAGDVHYGRLLAASIEAAGEAKEAYLLSGRRGQNLYYDDERRSLHRAFLVAPVRYRYMSSRFGRRFHPILQRYRAHLGYDFAADLGNPIQATGDGVIESAGRNGGYGLIVAIRHVRGIETRYAHMSRIARGIRPGVRVSQGDIIGFVGKSGLATGPHVHYEFLKNGRQIDYRTVDLGDGEPVPRVREAEFDSLRIDYGRLLNPARFQVMAPLEWD